MKIRTQLIISMVFFGIALLIISASVIITNQKVDWLNKQEELAKNIELKAGELSYLSNDYLLYHESQQVNRWKTKYSSLSDDLSNLNVDIPDQQVLVNNLKANQQRLNEVFDDTVSKIKSAPQTQPGTIDPAFIQTAWSRIAVQNQGIVFDSSRLSQKLRDEKDQLVLINNLLIFALLGTFVGFLLTNYFMIYQRTLKSVSNLQAGTRTIGSGNLDFSIEEKKDDEFGELAHAFNRMTINLKNITASKADLEREITERRQAEEMLRQSEQRLRRFYESGLVGVIYWNMNGAITDANDKFLEMVGYTREELVAGQIDWVNMTPPEYQHLDENSTAELKATGINKMPFEKEYIRKDDTRIPIIVAGAMLDEARFNGVAFVLDITERKRAEEALRESEERYATTLASIGDAVISTDVEGRVTFMNAVAESLTGWTLSEASTKTVIEVFNIINENTRREADNPVTRVLQEGTIIGLANHTILIRKDGTEVPIDDSGAPIRDRDGNIMGVVLVFRDITERKQAEEALHSAETKFRILVEQSLVGTYITQDKKIIYVNPKLAAILGYTQDEITSSKSVSDLIVEEDSDRVIENIRKRLRGEVQSIQHTFRGKRKDGILIDLEVHGTRTELDGKTVVIGTALDITERKQFESKLKDAAEKYSTLFDTTSDGIWIHNLEGQILEVNDAYCRMSGYARDEITGMPINKLEAIETPEDIANHIKKVVEAGGHDRFESQHRRKDGSIFDVDITALYLDRDGGRIAIFVRDITRRKRAEEEIKQANLKIANILESISDGFMSLDTEWRFTYVNQRAANNIGFTPEELIGQNIWEKFPNLIDTPHEVNYRKAMDERIDAHFELKGVLTDKWYEIRVYPSSEGITIYWLDLTGRKRAEEALRRAHDELELRVQERTAELEETNKALLESEASYRELTESINEVFFGMDRELRYTYWNKASEALTGISAKDAIGKSLYELFPDIKDTKAEQLYIDALKTQQPQRFESQFQLGDKKLTFEISTYPTKTGLSVIAKDITEKKMFEAHLLRAQRMESIGILAGGIAHNLNNMLTPMMLSLQMLKEKFKDEKSQKLLTILEQNSQRSADLIKQVLSFSRGVEGERNPLQVARIIAEIEKIAKETFPRNIEIRTDIQKDLSTISGDITQLHQVIMNLCVNARDAMPDGGILSITASNFQIDENYALMHTEAKVGPYVAISVSDTGIGIPHKVLDRIFEPFFTTKEFGKGTGLGLSTSLAIVKSHGGFIDVQSEVREGAKFSVYLPAILAETQNVEEQQLELLSGHGEQVLVVEDEDSVREITVSTLEKYGYNLLTASDGADAIAVYAQNSDKIRVILMDLMMPVMDGQASIQVIRKINPEIKIIAVSGLAEKDKLKNIAEHTNAFLSKPYTAEKLLKVIHEVLNAE